jgi:hypothetical protein
VAQGLDEWIAFPTSSCRADFSLSLRSSLAPACVTRADMANYLSKLVALSERPEEDARPQFVLEVGGACLTLFGTRHLRSAIRNTGPDIVGIELEEKDLQRLISKIFYADYQAYYQHGRQSPNNQSDY